MDGGSALIVDNARVRYGDLEALRGVSFSLAVGEIGCLLGGSGSGKTTALRAIAGFEQLRSGSVTLDGRLASGSGAHLPPEKRGVGMVFQDFALFTHLTVAQNVAFGLPSPRSREAAARAAEMLELAGLPDLSGRYPHELSGGQQQRVALARALAPRPRLVLLDEPFSSLDATLRERLSREVRDILKHESASALLVTHNQQEAFAMADVMGVMQEGRLLQWGTADDLYHRPVSRQVAEFVGEGVFLRGRATGETGGKAIHTAIGDLPCSAADACPLDGEVRVLIRPEDVIHDDLSPFKARIEARTFRGPNILFELRLENGETVLCLAGSHHRHQPGEMIGVRPEVTDVVAFPA